MDSISIIYITNIRKTKPQCHQSHSMESQIGLISHKNSNYNTISMNAQVNTILISIRYPLSINIQVKNINEDKVNNADKDGTIISIHKSIKNHGLINNKNYYSKFTANQVIILFIQVITLCYSDQVENYVIVIR